jgi:hypothetical protein
LMGERCKHGGEWKRATWRKIPFFVRGKVRPNIETIARKCTIARITAEPRKDAKAMFRLDLSVFCEMSSSQAVRSCLPSGVCPRAPRDCSHA